MSFVRHRFLAVESEVPEGNVRTATSRWVGRVPPRHVLQLRDPDIHPDPLRGVCGDPEQVRVAPSLFCARVCVWVLP